MIQPQNSSCFREGMNPGFLETVGQVREKKRMLGKPNGYLFTVWKKVSCCVDIPAAVEAALAIEALVLGCQLDGGE